MGMPGGATQVVGMGTHQAEHQAVPGKARRREVEEEEPGKEMQYEALHQGLVGRETPVAALRTARLDEGQPHLPGTGKLDVDLGTHHRWPRSKVLGRLQDIRREPNIL